MDAGHRSVPGRPCVAVSVAQRDKDLAVGHHEARARRRAGDVPDVREAVAERRTGGGGEGVKDLRAPFPYFGGKSAVAEVVWSRLGSPKQFIEPFCGSAAVLLAAPRPASLEVAGDLNCHIANFWRAVKCQPDAVAAEADYPVSHIDLAARHRWLVDAGRVRELAAQLADPEWPGDARIAGWWCWGQCAWIGSGWCETLHRPTNPGCTDRQIPFVGHAGRGLQRQGAALHRRRPGSAEARSLSCRAPEWASRESDGRTDGRTEQRMCRRRCRTRRTPAGARNGVPLTARESATGCASCPSDSPASGSFTAHGSGA